MWLYYLNAIKIWQIQLKRKYLVGKICFFWTKDFQIFCARIITFKKLRECVKNLVENVSQKFGLDLSKLCFEPFLIWDLRVRKKYFRWVNDWRCMNMPNFPWKFHDLKVGNVLAWTCANKVFIPIKADFRTSEQEKKIP